ncbi:MAG: hypothetical protein ACLQVD_04770 [Capsulimonadaceae bacterium]
MASVLTFAALILALLAIAAHPGHTEPSGDIVVLRQAGPAPQTAPAAPANGTDTSPSGQEPAQGAPAGGADIGSGSQPSTGANAPGVDTGRAQGSTETASTPPASVHFRARIDAVEALVNGRDGGAVTVNEQTALTLLSSDGGMTPIARARITAARLEGVIQSDTNAYALGEQKVDADTWAVTLQGGALVLVTGQEARLHDTTPDELAHEWVDHLINLLSQKPISPAIDHLIVPVGENRTIQVGGVARPGDIAVDMADAETAQADFDPGFRRLRIRGLAPGRTTLTLVSTIDGPAAAQVSVDVMKYAGHIEPVSVAAVTGSPAPPDIALRALCMSLARTVTIEPGAVIHLVDPPAITTGIGSSDHLTVGVPLVLSGPGLLPVRESEQITVSNQSVPSLLPEQLLYSNDPEQVQDARTLFAGRLYADVPARLVFHHQNIGGRPLGLHIDLINNTGQAMSIQVIAGVAEPAVDTIQVGRRAGAQFMQNMASDAGLIVTVPPDSDLPLLTQRLPSLYTASGIVEMHRLDGDGVLNVRVFTLDDQADTPADPPFNSLCAGETWSTGAPAALPQTDPPLDPPSTTVFPSPHIERQAAYTVGGPWAYLRLGHGDSLHDSTGKIPLDGNYGVDYNFALTLKNAGSIPRPVGIFFSPEAGTAAGAFRVDQGPVVEFDPTSPPDEPMIARIDLAAGETRTVNIQSIPLCGSYYPASITVHNL